MAGGACEFESDEGKNIVYICKAKQQKNFPSKPIFQLKRMKNSPSKKQQYLHELPVNRSTTYSNIGHECTCMCGCMTRCGQFDGDLCILTSLLEGSTVGPER